LAEYAYDARNRRIVKRSYDDAGNVSEVRHFYFTEQWQEIEERVARSSAGSSVGPESVAAERQLMWDRRYIDALLTRERDTDRDSILDEQVYVQQDANWNVARTQLTTGGLAERYAYTPYGAPGLLANDFGEIHYSELEFVHLFCGYARDAESQIYNVRNRVLHAHLGCWTSRDPLPETKQDSLYEYGQSRPLSFSDPLGTTPLAQFIAACGGCAACLGPGVAVCDAVSKRDLQVFMNCMRTYWNGLPTWHKCLCLGSCIRCPVTALAVRALLGGVKAF
jgi:RHS repeat-associated protein